MVIYFSEMHSQKEFFANEKCPNQLKATDGIGQGLVIGVASRQISSGSREELNGIYLERVEIVRKLQQLKTADNR